MAQGISPLSIEHLQKYYADIMRDSMGIMDSGEAIFYAQAQVEFFFYYAVSARNAAGSLPPAHDNIRAIWSLPTHLYR